MQPRADLNVQYRRQCRAVPARARSCWYDETPGAQGEVRACSSGRHQYRSTGQRWVREPPGARDGRLR